jgi:hypothetical protein
MIPKTPYDSIVSLPNSNSSSDRCFCGAAMKPQKTTIFFDDQRWDVVLQVCLKCHPAPSVPISHYTRSMDFMGNGASN